MKWFVVGGAGFVGSHLVDRLVARGYHVTVWDNFSTGKMWHLERWERNQNVNIVRGDAANLASMQSAMAGHDVVVHLAANADISIAAKEPTTDFFKGTLLTQNVLEAMRVNGIDQLLYASGSGVYGDRGATVLSETHSELQPNSPYGASKLGSEALIAAYCQMFDMQARCFRFANLVGPRQTHGVVYDFVRQLWKSPGMLHVLGDGTQSKSYLHIDDALDAVLRAFDIVTFAQVLTYNVATEDYVTVKQIAEATAGQDATIVYGSGRRGWQGDVPVVRLDTTRIRSLGWANTYTSMGAIRSSIVALKKELAR